MCHMFGVGEGGIEDAHHLKKNRGAMILTFKSNVLDSLHQLVWGDTEDAYHFWKKHTGCCDPNMQI